MQYYWWLGIASWRRQSCRLVNVQYRIMKENLCHGEKKWHEFAGRSKIDRIRVWLRFRGSVASRDKRLDATRPPYRATLPRGPSRWSSKAAEIISGISTSRRRRARRLVFTSTVYGARNATNANDDDRYLACAYLEPSGWSHVGHWRSHRRRLAAISSFWIRRRALASYRVFKRVHTCCLDTRERENGQIGRLI